MEKQFHELMASYFCIVDGYFVIEVERLLGDTWDPNLISIINSNLNKHVYILLSYQFMSDE